MKPIAQILAVTPALKTTRAVKAMKVCAMKAPQKIVLKIPILPDKLYRKIELPKEQKPYGFCSFIL